MVDFQRKILFLKKAQCALFLVVMQIQLQMDIYVRWNSHSFKIDQ
jgi:hypothetical protein